MRFYNNMRKLEDDMAHEALVNRVLEGSYSVPNPMPKDWIDKAVSRGMIDRHKLIDKQYYYGRCRNARVAMWNAIKAVFTYVRSKFGHEYPEDIHHPADDDGFDLFIPVTKVEPNDEERIQ